MHGAPSFRPFQIEYTQKKNHENLCDAQTPPLEPRLSVCASNIRNRQKHDKVSFEAKTFFRKSRKNVIF